MLLADLLLLWQAYNENSQIWFQDCSWISYGTLFISFIPMTFTPIQPLMLSSTSLSVCLSIPVLFWIIFFKFFLTQLKHILIFLKNRSLAKQRCQFSLLMICPWELTCLHAFECFFPSKSFLTDCVLINPH